MKKMILLAIILLSVSCQPKVVYSEGSKFCYVDTKEGRLWGVGNSIMHTLEPVYDTIIPALDERAYYASEKGAFKLYDIKGQVLCDGSELVAKPEFCSDYGGVGSQGEYARIYTTQGIYGAYFSFAWSQWCCYGPFKEYVAGNVGYMFQDPQTGKWGVGKYGDWEFDEYQIDVERRARLTPSKDILIPAMYEKIVNIAHSYSDTHWALGYKNKSDIRWYCYDGNQWYGFDIDGNPISVNSQELNRALSMPLHRSIRQSIYGMPTQRLGIEEASVLSIQH